MLVYGTQGSSNADVADLGTVKAAYDYRATVVAMRTKQQVAKCCPPFGEQVSLTEPTDKVTENFTGKGVRGERCGHACMSIAEPKGLGAERKEKDDETELNYFGARYLDPMLGLWTSVDAARQHFSPYTYGSNNPVNRFDPDGNADLRIAVFYNYDQNKKPVDGALLVRQEISKYNLAYDNVQIKSFGRNSNAGDIAKFLNGANQAAIAAHGGWNSSGIYKLGDGRAVSFPAKLVDGRLEQQTLLAACHAGDYIDANPESKFISPDIATEDGLVSSLSEAVRYIIQGFDSYEYDQKYSVDFGLSKPDTME